MSVSISGVNELANAWTKFAANIEPKVSDTLRTQTRRTLSHAIDNAPVQTGALRASGTVRPVGPLGYEIVFVGPLIPFAGQEAWLAHTVQEDANAIIAALAKAFVP